LEESKLLFKAHRYDGAAYLCGYAVELALKARICATLKWSGFPESSNEFHSYQSFKTHNLDVLLHLSGREQQIKSKSLIAWSAIAAWEPETRYTRIGTASEAGIRSMISSVEVLLKSL